MTSPIRFVAPAQSHAPDSLVMLRSTGAPAAKRWHLDADGQPEAVAFGNLYRFEARVANVRSLRELWQLVGAIEADSRVCVVRGALTPAGLREVEAGRAILRRKIPRTLEDGTVEAPTFEDAPRHWVCIDVDNLEAPPGLDPAADPEAAVRFVRSRLPSTFHRAACAYQWSASAFVRPGDRRCKLHLWFWLTTPRTSSELHDYLKVADPDKVADHNLAEPVQIHYTARPMFEGVADPFDARERVGLLPGDPGVEVPIIPASAGAWARRTSSSAREARPIVEAPTRVEGAHTFGSKRLTLRIDDAREKYRSERAPRHVLLYGAAVETGRDVGRGLVSMTEAVRELASWARGVGLTGNRAREATRTIDDGLAEGLAQVAESTVDLNRPNAPAPAWFPAVECTPGVHLWHADLGSGKTHQLARWARTGGRVLAVSHRRSLSRALAERLDLEVYEDLPEGPILAGGVAICIDSLCRIPAGERFDLVIIEESESTFAHLFTGGTIPARSTGDRPGSGEVFARLRDLVLECRAGGGAVVAADADLSDATRTVLAKLTDECPETFCEVTHLRPSARRIRQHESIASLDAALDAALEARERLVIACTTRRRVRTLAKHLDQRGVRFLDYDSTTSDERRRELENVEAHWSSVPVVLYSPTIDAGVSYTADPEGGRPVFDRVFLYGESNNAATPASLRQMVSRVRGDVPVEAFVARGWHDDPTTVEAVRAEYSDRTRLTERFAYSTTRTADGAVVRAPSDRQHFESAVAVEAIRRLRTRDVAGDWCAWWIGRGATLELVPPPDEARIATIRARMAEAREVEAAEYVAAVLAAEPMTDDEYQDVARRGARDLAEHFRVRRSYLDRTFGCANVDAELVEADRSGRAAGAVRWWRRLAAVATGDPDPLRCEDDAAVRDGHRAAHRAVTARARLAWIVLVNTIATPEALRELLAGDGQIPELPAWSAVSLEDAGARVLAALAAEGLDSHAACDGLGFNLSAFATGKGTVRAVGATLAALGLRTVNRQVRDGDDRVRWYTLDVPAGERTRRLHRLEVARYLTPRFPFEINVEDVSHTPCHTPRFLEDHPGCVTPREATG